MYKYIFLSHKSSLNTGVVDPMGVEPMSENVTHYKSLRRSGFLRNIFLGVFILRTKPCSSDIWAVKVSLLFPPPDLHIPNTETRKGTIPYFI